MELYKLNKLEKKIINYTCNSVYNKHCNDEC